MDTHVPPSLMDTHVPPSLMDTHEPSLMCSGVFGVLLTGGARDSTPSVASSRYKDGRPAEGGFAMQEPRRVAEAGAAGLVR